MLNRSLVVALALVLGAALAPAAPSSPFQSKPRKSAGKEKPESKKPENAYAAVLGRPMPRLELASWQNGEMEFPKDAAKKVLIVAFFEPGSEAAPAAIVRHNEILGRLGSRGLVFLGVAPSQTKPEALAALVKETGASYPIARDVKGKSAKAWGIGEFPTYAVMDGMTRVRSIGLPFESAAAVAEDLLKEIEPPAKK